MLATLARIKRALPLLLGDDLAPFVAQGFGGRRRDGIPVVERAHDGGHQRWRLRQCANGRLGEQEALLVARAMGGVHGGRLTPVPPQVQGPRGRYCRRFVDGANDLVVEVLAASTAAYDRGAKFAAYRKLPSLQEVLVIDSDGRRADLHREGTDGLWVLHPFEPGDAVQLRSVGLDLTVVQLFAEVDARPSGAAPV